MIRQLRPIIFVALVTFLCANSSALAKPPVMGALDTNGITFKLKTTTGEITQSDEQTLSGFSLGGTARRGGRFYYIAKPSGSSENSLFIVSLKTGILDIVDLDRDDDVRAMFFKGRKLYGMFYNGGTGLCGLYKINPSTGATSLVLDLGDLDIEPIAGSLAEYQGSYFMLVKPEIDSSQRKLLRFKTKSSGATSVDVTDASQVPVMCNKLKPRQATQSFTCLAQNAIETEVMVCNLTLRGRATCKDPLPDIVRVGSGHTMLTADERSYYAFVYAPGEPDNQRLIKFNAAGTIKSNIVLDRIYIGGHFKQERNEQPGSN